MKVLELSDIQQKVKQWLDDHNIEYTIEVKEDVDYMVYNNNTNEWVIEPRILINPTGNDNHIELHGCVYQNNPEEFGIYQDFSYSRLSVDEISELIIQDLKEYFKNTLNIPKQERGLL